MEKIDKFYKNVNGSAFIFLGLAFSITTIVVSVALYTSTGVGYSIFTHYISDLGAVNSSPNNAHVVFNVGTMIGSFISPFTTMFLLSFLRKKGTDKKLIAVWFTCNVISIIGSFMAGFFPEDVIYIMHFIGAFLVFFFGMMSHGFFGFAAITTPAINSKHGFPGLLVGTVNTIFMFLFISNIGLSAIVFFEWMSMFFAWIFSLDIGIYTLRTQD